MNRNAVAGGWRSRGFSCDLWVDQPGQVWPDFVYGSAGRNEEIVRFLDVDTLWSYKRWAVKALAAMGKGDEAIRYAEACRSPWASDLDIDGKAARQCNGNPGAHSNDGGE
ncbi:MAG: hypothetical protein HY270_23715 [Deltaproteobacteria bacterium]|nr:hypothetical protein [Deltaproteobacteria bacterium]